MFKLIGTGVEPYLNSGLLPLFYSIIILSYVYLLKKHRYTKTNIFIVFIFLSGFFEYLPAYIDNTYKVFLLLFAIYISLKEKTTFVSNKLIVIILSFFILTVVFFTSSIVNDIYFVRIIAQYVSRYLTGFIILLYIYKISLNNTNKLIRIRDLTIDLLLFQGIFSAIKILIFGFGESLVGSIQFNGGNTVNVLPIIALGLIFQKKGIKLKENWKYLIILMLVPLASTKRSFWFYLPVYLGLMFYYVNKSRIRFRFDKFVTTSIFIILLFFITIKLTPSLNPDKKIWGTFDPGYTYNYSYEYIFGKRTTNVSTGRASNINFSLQQINYDNLGIEQLFGLGFDKFRNVDYEHFDAERYGVGNKGSLSAFSQDLLFLGVLGMIATVFYQLSVLYLIDNKRVRFVYLFFVFLEYLIYYNNFFGNNALVLGFSVLIMLYRKQVMNKGDMLYA